jgi:hypothetical protein
VNFTYHIPINGLVYSFFPEEKIVPMIVFVTICKKWFTVGVIIQNCTDEDWWFSVNNGEH